MSGNAKHYSLPALAALLLLVLSGCAAPQPAGLTDQQVSALTGNILQALDENDYPRFVQDFSDPMLAAFSEDQFSQLRDMLQAASGSYVSIGELNLSNAQGYAVYRLSCQYDLETVTVTITFAIDGEKVEGLFFTSPNLRKANP